MTDSKQTSWSQNFIRKVVRAEFTLDDNLPEFTPTGGGVGSSTRNYLAANKASRFGDRLIRFAVTLFFGLIFVGIVGGWRKLAENNELWVQAAAGLLALYSLVMVLLSQGYLRWMHRHRKDPRRKKG